MRYCSYARSASYRTSRRVATNASYGEPDPLVRVRVGPGGEREVVPTQRR